MDLVFGSSGIAQADQERMRQINEEIGLTRLMQFGHENSSDEKVAEAPGAERVLDSSEKTA